MPERRFPLPRSVEELDACFVVLRSHRAGARLIYFEDEPGQRIRSRALAKLNSHYQNGFQVGLSVNFR